MVPMRRMMILPLLLMVFLNSVAPAAARTPDERSAPQAEIFEVFTEPNFGGTRCWSVAAEAANFHSACNDQISSIRVQPGWSVRVYRDQYQAGSSRCFIGSDANLSDNTFHDGGSANDAMSSFRLVASPTCDPINAFEVFNAGDFQGGMCYSGSPERANINAYCADQVSSLLLRSGWSVWLYRDANQSGPYVCISGSDANLSDNRYSDGSIINDTVSSFALYQQGSCPITQPSPPPPPPAPPVPFFWQGDPQWRSHALRSCTGQCSTVGACGCTLTSAAMLFKHFGANLTPATLNSCMYTRACPFYWGVGANCSQGKARWVSRYAFSWQMLSEQINVHRRPVILGMSRNGNTHWVVVYQGSGSSPDNYLINDPGYKGGAANKLSANYRYWKYDWISVYARTSTKMAFEAPAGDATAADMPRIVDVEPTAQQAQAPDALSGEVLIYSRDETSMIVELIVSGAAPETVDVLVSSPNNPNTLWQPYSQFMTLAHDDTVTATFRTSSGEQAGPYTVSVAPVVDVPDGAFSTLVPLIPR